MGDDSSGGFSFGGTGYSAPSSWGLTDTPSSTPNFSEQNSSIPGYNYGDTSGSSGSSYSPWYQQQDMASAEQALGPDGQFGAEALQDNGFNPGRQGPTQQDVDYDTLDWLKGNWQKYSDRLGKFGLGVLSRTHPAAATAVTLYNLFNSPRNAVAGQVGGQLASAVGGTISPALAGVAGMAGSDLAQSAARNAELTYGMDATNGPTGSQGRTGSMDWGAAGAGLGQIWNRYGASKEYSNQGKQLQDLYGPNSAYSQQLQQQLLRADAKSGRRSQFGTRNVELQARLADLASRNAPQLQNLTKARTDERNKMYTDLYSLGRMFS
jgi:hypothetical protein